MTKPTYCLSMVKSNGAPNFCELDPDEWALVDNSPEQYAIFVIDGAEVKVLVATEDKTMTRQDALKTASSFVFGRYEKITIDLKRLLTQVEKGIDHRPKPHPPL